MGETNAIVTGAASGIGRVASPEEIGDIIATMLSDAAAYVHGSVVWADGGMDAAIRPDDF